MAGQGLRAFRRGAAPRVPRVEEARVIRVEGQEVAYTLRRSARRTFGLQIDGRGVTVAVPVRALDADVERFIVGNGRWMLDKLAAYAARPAPTLFDPGDGAVFPLLGENCRLRFAGTGRAARWRRGADGVEELVLGAGIDVRTAMLRALRRRALPWFAERLAEYCYRLGRPAPALRLSSARTRWGSCSAASGIRLHWRLIHLPPALIDYVVAHEVAHLVEMNHSPRFWAVVERLYPDWRSAREALRVAGRALPLIEPRADNGLLDEN